MPERWCVHPQAALHWRQIDGEWLIYENSTGVTHMIDHLSAAVLTCFESCADLAMPELLDQLNTDLALDATPDQVATAVRQFCAIGLLLPNPSPLALHASA